MEAVSTQDTGRVSKLYERFGPSIYARCRRMIRDDAAAEDATQEVFLRVLRHLDSAPDDESIVAWISRISTNYCLNVLRDGARDEVPTDEVPEESTAGFEASVISRDLTERLMESTPSHLKAPVLLYHVRGMEQAEVAKALGVSRRTVIYRLKEFADRARRLASGGMAAS